MKGIFFPGGAESESHGDVVVVWFTKEFWRLPRIFARSPLQLCKSVAVVGCDAHTTWQLYKACMTKGKCSESEPDNLTAVNAPFLRAL